MYRKVLLFAGTMEGRRLFQCLQGLAVPSVVYVATEYGEQLLEAGADSIRVHAGRLNEAEMEEELRREAPELVIDATHPYAVLVSQNIREACEKQSIRYLRVIRDTQDCGQADVCVDTMEQAAEWLNAQEMGKILVTTGSKELPVLAERIDSKERLVVRILPSSAMLETCERLGLKGRQIICMQGPFSEEMNYLIMKEQDIVYLLTKESGTQGGFQEKLAAAERAGVKTVVIGRPLQEEGCRVEEIEELLRSPESELVCRGKDR